MAKRESQGLQISLILLVMLSVILCVTTYFFWSQSQKFSKESISLKASAADNNRKVQQAVTEYQTLKEYLGFDANLDLAQIQQSYESDMLLYGQGVPESERNYRNLPAQLVKTIQEKNSQIKDLLASERSLKDEVEQEQKDALAQINEHKEAHMKADSDLQEQRSVFEKQVNDLKTSIAEIEAKHQSIQGRLKKENKTLTTELAAMTADLANLRESHRQLDEKLQRLQLKSFEHPDGKITYVNQAARTVYLNIGKADKLQRQTTFSVYDVDENNLVRSQPKGSIEVIRVIGDHLAEARVLEDNYADPIIGGDTVYSPLWQAGKSVHFALAGMFDTNEDGVDNTEFIKNLIGLNGGVVDAQVSATGERTGEMSIETRYIVIGKKPASRTAVEGGAEAYEKLRSEAKNLGVTEMSLDRFLADMGYQSIGRTVMLGENAEVRKIDRNSTRRPTAERFRPRRPPSASLTKSASE